MIQQTIDTDSQDPFKAESGGSQGVELIQTVSLKFFDNLLGALFNINEDNILLPGLTGSLIHGRPNNSIIDSRIFAEET